MKTNNALNTNNFPSIWNEFLDSNWLTSPSEELNTPVAANIKESTKDFTIEMAVPGIKKENINIKLENNVLSISGENKSSQETAEDNNTQYTRKEFSYNTFSRVFTLPKTANTENISASHNDGILTITIPKKEEAIVKPAKTIEIK